MLESNEGGPAGDALPGHWPVSSLAAARESLSRGRLSRSSMSGRIFPKIMVAMAGVGCMAIVLVACPKPAQAQASRIAPPTQFPAPPLASALTDDNLDDSVSAEWVGGAEHPVAQPGKVRDRFWTTARTAQYGTLTFGAGT